VANWRVAYFAKDQETTVTRRAEGEGGIAWTSFCRNPKWFIKRKRVKYGRIDTH
jgi:hypothetical protein